MANRGACRVRAGFEPDCQAALTCTSTRSGKRCGRRHEYNAVELRYSITGGTVHTTTEETVSTFAARAFRAVTDAIILAVAFVTGVVLDHVWSQVVREQVVPPLSDYLASVTPTLPFLVLLGVSVFSASGFYTRRRFYRSRYKAYAVLQGTAVTFLLFTSTAYALRSYLTFPTAVGIALSAVVAGMLLLTARVYATLLVALLQQPEHESTTLPVSKASSPRVLAIGGAGYIGSALIPQLLHAGYTVRVLDSLIFGKDAIAEYADDPHVELLEGDFRRVDQLVAAMQDVDVVVHLGGLVGDPACAVDEELTIEINLSATRAVAELAKAHGVEKFIFASTCSVYGASDEILDERSMLRPVSLYAKSKIASERVLHEVSESHFQPTILRFGTVYGLSGRTRFDLVVNLLTAKAATDGVITVFGPDQWRPFVHVSDVALAILCAIQAPMSVTAGRVYNVGSNDQNITLGQLGRRVREHVPSAELLVSDGDGDTRNYRVNFDRIADELKFAPQWTLDEGIEQILEALKSQALGDYAAEEYSNVKVVQSLVQREAVRAQRLEHLSLLDSKVGFIENPEEDIEASQAMRG